MGRRLKGRIGIGWDIENEGESGSEDEGMQQEDSGGRDTFSFGCAALEAGCETCRRNRLMDVGYMCV